MSPIAVDTELVEPDYLRLTLWASIRSVFVAIIYGVNLVAFIAIMPGIISGRAKPLTPFQLVFQAFILVGLPCILYFSSKAAFRKLTPSQRNVRYLFTHDGVETVTGLASSSISWLAIQKVAETSSAFYVSSHKNLYQVVPKRSFNADSDIERFRQLTKSKLGSKAHVRQTISSNDSK